jgi:hypothetical protein
MAKPWVDDLKSQRYRDKKSGHFLSAGAVELTPYRDRQQQATVTEDDVDEARQAWEAEAE